MVEQTLTTLCEMFAARGMKATVVQCEGSPKMLEDAIVAHAGRTLEFDFVLFKLAEMLDESGGADETLKKILAEFLEVREEVRQFAVSQKEVVLRELRMKKAASSSDEVVGGSASSSSEESRLYRLASLDGVLVDAAFMAEHGMIHQPPSSVSVNVNTEYLHAAAPGDEKLKRLFKKEGAKELGRFGLRIAADVSRTSVAQVRAAVEATAKRLERIEEGEVEEGH